MIKRGEAPPLPSHDLTSQGPHSLSPEPPYNQESGTHTPVKALQEASKARVLQSLGVLHKIAMNYQSLNLGVETVDGWISEIEGVNATTIPIPFNATVLDRFQIQNYIHTECITASSSMQYSIMRGIALQLLEYILTCAEEYYLAQSPCVYIGIGRWIERPGEI